MKIKCEIGDAIRRKLKIDQTPSVGDIVMDQFKQEFDKMYKQNKYIVLTSMPKESSIIFLKNTFGVTEHKDKRATQIQNENGFFSTPNPKLGRRLPEATIVKGQEFYESDEVSRQMPGRKDSVSMLLNGDKQHVQKQLILLIEYEAFLLFKEKHPDVKLGFSKFAEARPKNFVL